jgi:hypothetical protein
MWPMIISAIVQAMAKQTMDRASQPARDYSNDPSSPESLAAENEKAMTGYKQQRNTDQRIATAGGQQYSVGTSPTAMSNAQLSIYGQHDTMTPGWKELINQAKALLAGDTGDPSTWGGTGEGGDSQSEGNQSGNTGDGNSNR